MLTYPITPAEATVRDLKALLALLLLAPLLAHAQTNYPTRPVRFISAYAPGGSTSTVARFVGGKLTEAWGQQVVIENRPGGNTIIGTDATAKATPDGYTIFLTTNSHVILPSLIPRLPYDVFKDFAPVCAVYRGEFVLVINAQVPANTLQELIAYSKSRPGQINYGTTGAGGSTHLANELLNMVTGMKNQHIPYKGAGPAIVDLIGGQVQMFMNNALTLIPHIKSGRVKGIAVTGETRIPSLPQVPTFTEGGVPGVDVYPWFFVLAPAGTPKPIVAKLAADITRVVNTSDFNDFITRQGMSPYTSTTEQLAAMMRADYAKYAKVIKAAGIKLEN